MNWVSFVKEFATNKGITYRQALKDSECKETYHKQKGEQNEVKKRPSTKQSKTFESLLLPTEEIRVPP
jgi:hypothetical protein